MVNKPRNINDLDLIDNGPQLVVPMSQPTDTSYFLQRLRLAEISRSIVDHNLMSVTSSDRPGNYAHVIAMNFELDQMIHTLPLFFQLDSYERNPDYNIGSSIFIQAYLLNSLMHTQRCKLNLVYLTLGPSNNPAYASSRDVCLSSAQQIIRAEIQLVKSKHPFLRVRLRLAAILYSVFMASIVLFMDVCVNYPSSLDDEILHGDMAEALRIIEDVKKYSLAAANLHESLKQILSKHRTQHQQQQIPEAQVTPQQGGECPAAADAGIMNTGAAYMYQKSDSLVFVLNPDQISRGDLDRSQRLGAFSDEMSITTGQMAQSLDDPMYLDNFQWEDLFSDIATSSFFLNCEAPRNPSSDVSS